MPFVVLIDTPDPVELQRLQQRVALGSAAGQLCSRITSDGAESIWAADTLRRSDLEAVVHVVPVTEEHRRAHFLFADVALDARNVTHDVTLEGGGCLRLRAFDVR